MKHLSLLLLAGTLATPLIAQPMPETTHCRMDSMLMAGYHYSPDEVSYHKIAYTFDEKDAVLSVVNSSKRVSAEYIEDWHIETIETYTNNAAGLPTTVISKYYDEGKGSWIESEKTTYEYDANGNCIKNEGYGMNWDDYSLFLSHTATYAYDSQNRIIEQIYSEGVYTCKYTYSYGNYGIESETRYIKEGDNWEVSYVEEYAYDEKGQIVRETSKYPAEGTWYYTYYRTYTYDENGYLASQSVYNGCQTDYNLLTFSTGSTFTCNAKGLVVKEEMRWSDEEAVSERHEYAYDEHDDLVNLKAYRKDYDPETWEPLPELVLHEEMTYYFKCIGASGIGQLNAKPVQHGIVLQNGKLVIMSGDKCYDLSGHAIK